MATTRKSLLIIGGGPRGLGVVERLAANGDAFSSARLDITVADPLPAGAGKVWRENQSPLLRMNSRAKDVTVYTDSSFTGAGPVAEGPSLDEWAERVAAGDIVVDGADDELAEEIADLGPEDFASRRAQARYLGWALEEAEGRLPATIRATHRRASVTGLRRGEDGRLVATLTDEDGGTEELKANLAVVVTGHTDSRHGPREERLNEFAGRHGLTYRGPGQPQDSSLDEIEPGELALVTGMGLTFVDLVALLFEGRGGGFEPDPTPGDPGRLRYVPSGREPRLAAGSRRGVPRLSKVAASLAGPAPKGPAILTDEFLDALPEGFHFSRDVLPRALAEIEYHVYRELFAAHPERTRGSWDEFAERFVAADDDAAARAELVAEAVPNESDRLSLADVNDPLRELDTRDLGARDEAVARVIRADLEARTDPDRTDTAALVAGVLIAHAQLARRLPAHRQDPDYAEEFPGRWQTFFSLVGSGPPPFRLQEILALHRAGYVSFLGPRSGVAADEDKGLFVATIDGEPTEVRARALVDAFLPHNDIKNSVSPLLRGLIGDGGLGREYVPAPGFHSGKLDITADHRLVGPDGEPHDDLWAAGPPTKEVPLGAFVRPGIDAPTLRYNDEIARAILAAASGDGDAGDQDD
ncbi:FAD/NAD(P)-binding protein [Corynebacterium otitidis]|uniref:FAD/NAD(P)-binding protein n=1 Tax=Corynebacterium otitidis TaxID=29321 RepID=UPI000627F944|nr:FAD/NAD(P)-binding protein [Corynebacterium otitidis]KKO84410.1 hypothetical protein AAV33_01190 [Corynebacterium otitidis]